MPRKFPFNPQICTFSITTRIVYDKKFAFENLFRAGRSLYHIINNTFFFSDIINLFGVQDLSWTSNFSGVQDLSWTDFFGF
jgi:hypothetical protein